MRHWWLRIVVGFVFAAALSGQFVSNVELVDMVFTVQDNHNAFVTGLTEKDFAVTEDKRSETIRYFTEESDLPLTLGLLIDTSSSQTNVLDEEQAASRIFFKQVITPQDRAFVVSFDDRVYLLQDLTASQALLGGALNRARIGHSTALWDAILLACRSRMEKVVGRKALVIATDGGATPSEYSYADALRFALNTNTVVYFVDISDSGGYGGGGFGGSGGGPAGPDELETLARDTGGRTIDGNQKKLAQAFAQIADDLRHQYTLAYRTDRPKHDGTFRRVVIVEPGAKGVKIRTRIGYTMAAY